MERGFRAIEPDGIGLQLKRALEADFQTNVVAVYLHRAGTDFQLVGRVLTGVTLGHEDHDFQFPIGQVMKMVIIPLHVPGMADK